MIKEEAHKRFLQALEYLRNNGEARTTKEIVEKLDYARQNVSAALNGNLRYISDPFLRRFAAAYSDYIDERWLLTGEGVMAKPEPDMRPHVEPATRSGEEEDDPMEGAGYHRPGEFLPDYEFSFTVPDEAMTPMFLRGDVLTCSRVPRPGDLETGRPYVFFAGGPGLLRLLDGRTPAWLRLRALDPAYPATSLRPASLRLTGRPSGLLRRLP